MDCQTVEQNVDVIELPWAAVETEITRAGRGVVGVEQGDLVCIVGSEKIGVLTRSKTISVFGEDITDSVARVDIAKNKVRSTAFYDADNVPAAAGAKVYYNKSTGKLTSSTSSTVLAGIYLGLDNAVMRFILQ